MMAVIPYVIDGHKRILRSYDYAFVAGLVDRVGPGDRASSLYQGLFDVSPYSAGIVNESTRGQDSSVLVTGSEKALYVLPLAVLISAV